ncbi:MAG TPA: hypothetical protein VKQ32_09990 [Polyangia bacterium]|nr:hypothetical protein [Polyangia bacterium]
MKLLQAVAAQIASNESVRGHEATFADHRARLTREILDRAPTSGGGRLCLLGAGNANDVDLDALAARFAEIHLGDIDPDAIARAIARVAPAQRPKLTAHAPLDVSGLFDQFDDWAARPPAPQAIAGIVAAAVERVVGALPGPFDVVVSCSLLTQLQLVLVQVVGDRNPSFVALREALNRAHVRTLGALLAPGGVALLVTDLTSTEIYPPLANVDAGADLGKLMSDLLAAGHVIYAANPGLLSSEMRRDPQLKQAFDVRSPIGPWIWRNGPTQSLLVYALEIRRRG